MIARTRQWLAERTDGGRQGTTLVLVLLVVALLGWILWDRTRAEQEAELAADNAAAIAEQVRDACAREGPVALQLGDLCRQAEQVAEEPAEPVAIPPTDEQLRPIVERFVAEWLAANPPRDGRDGRTPTVAEISTLIMAELAANPPPAGEDGRTPTAADIRPIVVEEVAAFLEANPPPAGEDGEDGQDGEDGERGPPGPTCPEGTTLQERRVVGPPPETWFVCVQDEEEPAEP